MVSNTYKLMTLLLTFALFLIGCGGGKTQEPAAPSGQAAKPQEQAAPASDEVRTIEHAMGTTEIKGTPQKVVILTNEGTEALLALGVKPVGAVKSWTGDPYYEHIAAEMEGVEVVGTESQVNLEAIVALQPDLIIGNKMRQEKVYQQLSAIAPTVFSDTLRGQWKPNFELYAKALNKEEEGRKVIGDFDQRIEEFKTQFADKLNLEVSIVRFMAGKTRIYYKDTFSGVIFEQIGLARPAAQNKPEFADEITKERTPEMEGDILFYFTYDTGDGEANKNEQEWLKDPLFQNLNVVKNNRAYKVNDAIWNTAGGVKAANLLLDDITKIYSELK
ncbi:ABC transporter substrate-binding protein [Ammoniphilus sp. CFH 90114]|uniref:ABC transporter substrate-binding protein n=1 Tax=Ammoniphilus sp. CFH 90114 TaxID=2493665 RepID=UPI00100F9E14|nr:iron-siderophore ABC transporter substrate-binding protein [Ammoniphilus sp. CFH 90114]RXT05244.1 iron-siderophore ABC transporter substrate-binding protein [Ammoniphilus sp. CFH 90114]